MTRTPGALILVKPELVRARMIGECFETSLKARDWQTTLVTDLSAAREEVGRCDLAVGYGRIWAEIFRAAPAFIYAELGVWNRKPPAGPLLGHHRLMTDLDHTDPAPWSVGDPQAFRRLEELGVRIRAWRPPAERALSDVRRHKVLITGRSARADLAEGRPAGAWVDDMIAIAGAMGYHVTYRPKPTRQDVPAPDAWSHRISDPDRETLAEALASVGQVWTRPGGVALEALAAGLPTWANDAPGPWAATRGDAFWQPEPEDRAGILAAWAVRHWTPAEISEGAWITRYPEPWNTEQSLLSSRDAVRGSVITSGGHA